jgi:archaellum component FlaG (FlaF/FlaG flagellin family)
VTRRIVLMLAALLLVAGAMGIYAWRLHKKVTADEERLAAQQQTVAPPANGPTATLTLYVASDANATLYKKQISIPLPAERSEQARSILRALFSTYLQSGSPHPIGAGADVRDVYLLSDGSAVVDTNAAFADAHPSGVLAEELTITSIVATLNANDPKINRVKIIINGTERDTLAGHADLRRYYLASNMGQLAKELQ